MKTFKFRTNIKDAEEYKTLQSYLNNIEGIKEIECDLDDPGRILTIKAEGLNRETVSRDVFKAGFRNEPLDSAWNKTVGRLFKKDCCK